MIKPPSTTAVIRIVGLGIVGLRAVKAMAGGIQGAECIGLELVRSKSELQESLVRVVLPDVGYKQELDFSRLFELIGDADFVFLVVSLDECIGALLEHLCREARSRLIKLILVSPEPNATNERRDIVTRQCQGTYKDYEIAFPKTALNVVNHLFGMLLVSDKSLSSEIPSWPTHMNMATLTDYLLQHAIEKIIYFITYKPYIRSKFTDLQIIWHKVARYGVGIGSGPFKEVLAAQKAFSGLKRQGICNSTVQGMLCCVTGASDMTTEDVKTITQYVTSLVPIDTPIVFGVIVDAQLEDDVMMVSIMAAEKLLSDTPVTQVHSSQSWAIMCEEELRNIPAFERKKWFVEDNISVC